MNKPLIIALLALAFTGAAQAAPPGSMRVADPNGATFAEVIGSGAALIYYLNLPADFVDPDAALEDYTALYDPETGVLTDVFGINAEGPNGGLDLAFTISLAALIGPGNIVLANTGAVMDATHYLKPGLRAEGWTASYTPSAIAAVPEPASYGLMALGLMGVALLVNRRRVQA